MPRLYIRMGARKRSEQICALFTVAEKERVMKAALECGVPTSVFVHNVVLARVDEQVAA
jgi:hypothetical protein